MKGIALETCVNNSLGKRKVANTCFLFSGIYQSHPVKDLSASWILFIYLSSLLVQGQHCGSLNKVDKDQRGVTELLGGEDGSEIPNWT